MAVAATATATALVVGVVGVVLAVDDDPSEASNLTNTSPSEPAPSATPTPSPTPTRTVPPLLLPNMKSIGASDLQIEVVGNTRRLRFAAALANVGPGPLFLVPRGRGECPRGQHQAVQILHRDLNKNGTFQRARDREGTRRVSGCMLLHSGHRHWHFDAMAAYSLRRAGATQVLVSREKVSFCLRDNYKVPRQKVVVRRHHFGRCTRSSQPQGISPGWVDLYRADLSGQWLRLPANVGSDVLCLDLEADPLGRLVETDETDNAMSVAFRIDGTRIRKANSGACR